MATAQPQLARQIATQRFERRLAVVMVVAPIVGLIAAIVLAWGRGAGPVELGLFCTFYVATVLGVEVGLHRHFSHRAFKARPAVRVSLAILGSMAAQGPVLFWAAIHRRHHACSDQPGDPHSPGVAGDGRFVRLRGLWHAHVGWLFEHEGIDLGIYTPDLLRDRLVFKLSYLYPLWIVLGIALPAAAGWLLIGGWRGCVSGALWGGLVRIFFVHHATWSVNSLCHMFGSRPFETHDRSTNNAWLLPTSLGGCWHNNHHAQPQLAYNSRHWWQLDPSGWLIWLLERAGLVWDVRVHDPGRAAAAGPAGTAAAAQRAAPPHTV